MESALGRDRGELSRSTSVRDLAASQTSGGIPSEAGVQLRVRFRLSGGLVDVFSRGTWQEAYEVHDTTLRLLYWIKVKRKGILSTQVADPAKYLKKAALYWTRNPDLTDNVTNRIWAMVVDEEKIPHFFDLEEKLKDCLFTFDRRILVPASALHSGSDELAVEVKVRWGRHSYIEKGHTTATSQPLKVKR